MAGSYMNHAPLSIELSWIAIIAKDLFIITGMIEWFIYFNTYMASPNDFQFIPLMNFDQVL